MKRGSGWDLAWGRGNAQVGWQVVSGPGWGMSLPLTHTGFREPRLPLRGSLVTAPPFLSSLCSYIKRGKDGGLEIAALALDIATLGYGCYF